MRCLPIAEYAARIGKSQVSVRENASSAARCLGQ